MVTFDASHAECLVFTLKEGLLSPIAHDLRLRVTSLRLQVSEAPWLVEAEAEAGSLRVETAMRDGAPLPGALSQADHRKIEANIRDDVLHARRYPTIAFVSRDVRRTPAGIELLGALTLHGTTRTLTVPVAETGGRLVAELRLHQPDFGIQPYRALLGTLRVQPRVRVTVALPADSVPRP